MKKKTTTNTELTVKLEKIPIVNIKVDEENPRIDLQADDSEFKRIKASMEEFGVVEPIILHTDTLTIISGHQRRKILIEQGITDLYLLPLGSITWAISNLDLQPLSEMQRKALNITLNNKDVGGEYDFERLAHVLQDLKEAGYDFTITGFSGDKLDSMIADFAIPGTEKEFDETCADDVKMVKCPECGHEFPA